MIKVKEGQTFKREGCKKEWKALYIFHGKGKGFFVCGNKEFEKEVPDWGGCGHVNTIEITGG